MRIGELLETKLDCMSEVDYLTMTSNLMVMYSLGLLKAGVNPETLKMVPYHEMNRNFFAVKVLETGKGAYLLEHDFAHDPITVKYGGRMWLHG